ncbi:MAG: DUF3108 domain-containing protein [SAR324 cluster bacterium]|nr:DUF3108 domain-containing protein [SAR324 cluster bacterium]
MSCPLNVPARPQYAPSEIYQNSPFKAGEKAVYAVRYTGIVAGHIYMDVKPPILHKETWHRHFRTEVKSLESYENIYRIHDVMESISDSHDFRIAQFLFKQDEQSFFSNHFWKQKSLVFDHEHCLVTETIRRENKKDKVKSFALIRGAKDTLGMIYYLRTLDYEINIPQRTMVYSSEKNWWLETYPIAKEKVTVPAGEFSATKLKLTTYLGKELQQQGDVYLWIADTPNRPVVLIHGDVKIGSLRFEMTEYVPGIQRIPDHAVTNYARPASLRVVQ